MQRRILAVSALVLPTLSFAAAPAVTDSVTEIATYSAGIAAIGLAVLAIVLVVKGVKWFRSAL